MHYTIHSVVLFSVECYSGPDGGAEYCDDCACLAVSAYLWNYMSTLTRACARLTALFQDYPGELVPER